MSVEITTVICALIGCGTFLFSQWMGKPQRIEDDVNARVTKISDVFNSKVSVVDRNIKLTMDDYVSLKELYIELTTRVKVLEENQVVMLKTVDEAKKLISQQSLSAMTQGFGARAR